MASTLDYTRLRADLDLTEAAFSNTEAEAAFVEAAERYSDTATAYAYARVIVIRRLIMAASKRSGYKKNQTTENLQEVVENLKDRLEEWQAEVKTLDDAATVAGSAFGKARFGRTRRLPSKVREYPGWV